jgi:hypothetical protein
VYGEVPDTSHLVPFYSPGVCHVPKDERKSKSWHWKAMPCRMMGYSKSSKDTYTVLNPVVGGVKERRDCIFNESLFEIVKEAQRHPEVKLNIYKMFNIFTQFNIHTTDDIDVPVGEIDELGDKFTSTNDDVTVRTMYAEFITDWRSDVAYNMLDIPKLPHSPDTRGARCS